MQERVRRRINTFPQLKSIRESLSQLPDTAATTHISDCISGPGTHLTNSDLLPLNTWFVPRDRLTDSTATSRRIVNPAYPHLQKYSPIYIKVKVTNIVTSADGNDTELNSTQYKRKMSEARSEFQDKRWEFIKQAADHSYSINDVAKRLDVYDPKYIYKIAEKQDQNYRKMRLRGRDKVARVWEELNYEADYSHKEIANVYGVGRSTVTDYINDHNIGTRKL